MFTACPVCQSSAIRLRYNGRTNRDPSDGRVWPVYECLSCEHGFINPQPDQETLNRYYSASYEAYDENHAADGSDEEVIEEAKRTGEFRHIPLPEGKRVLDFGSGGGYFLRICRQLGAMVQGIEPSKHGAALARKQGIPVFEGSLDDYLKDHGSDRFDIITSNHVIEHVPDPVETLRGLKTLLADGGQMVIAVPNARSAMAEALGTEWHSVDLPFHIHQFSAKSLKVAAERASLSTKEIGTTSIPAGTAASLRVLLRRKYLIPQKLTQRLSILDRYSHRLARRYDAEKRGEALLARFAD